jgi:hypothetical protein
MPEPTVMDVVVIEQFLFFGGFCNFFTRLDYQSNAKPLSWRAGFISELSSLR